MNFQDNTELFNRASFILQEFKHFQASLEYLLGDIKYYSGIIEICSIVRESIVSLPNRNVSDIDRLLKLIHSMIVIFSNPKKKGTEYTYIAKRLVNMLNKYQQLVYDYNNEILRVRVEKEEDSL